MLDALVTDALGLLAGGNDRRILAIAGGPGAGKSTLAQRIVDEACRRGGADLAAYVPLDGFHLSNSQLERLELLHRKGAPATFDVHGYLALLRRLLAETSHPVYVPDYDRVTMNESIAARLMIPPAARLIVTEGNYLACDLPGWRNVRDLADTLWFLDVPDEVREARLVERQLMGGRSREAASTWVATSDHPNGEVVKVSRSNCDRVIPSVPLDSSR